MSLPARAQAGFTLLEVLVALAILAIGVVTVIELSSQSLRLVKTSGDYQQAVQLADRLATDTQPTDEGVEAGEQGAFQWERRVSLVALPQELEPKETVPGREPAKLFAVTIDIRWGRKQELQLATLRTPTTTPASAQNPALTGVPGQQPVSATPRAPGARIPRAGGL